MALARPVSALRGGAPPLGCLSRRAYDGEVNPTSSDLHGHHDWHSSEYVEGWISGDVTHDDDRRPTLRRLASLIALGTGSAPRVLDLGGGYGMLSREVLEELPEANVVLHDFSEPMLAQAKTRLAEFGDRVRYVLADIRERGWSELVGGPFDAVVSSIAIHNVRDPAVIRQVYRDVFGIVAPGGSFFNLDFVQPAGPRTAQALRLSDRQRSDTDAVERPTVANHLRWLVDAGFVETDCLLRDDRQALLGAFRAS